jgi:hypothetical protein
MPVDLRNAARSRKTAKAALRRSSGMEWEAALKLMRALISSGFIADARASLVEVTKSFGNDASRRRAQPLSQQ